MQKFAYVVSRGTVCILLLAIYEVFSKTDEKILKKIKNNRHFRKSLRI